jgi:superfamily II DNA helicase RecQ
MSDTMQAPIEEQPVDPALTGQPEEPYFSWQDPDGKAVTFKTREELEKGFKDSFFMRSDYTRKTQETAAERKKIEEERQRLMKMMDDVKGKSSQYEKFDKYLRERPDVFRELQRRMTSPPDPETLMERSQQYVDQTAGELKKELEEMKAWKREMELEKEKSALYEELSSQYPDLNREEIDHMLMKLSEGGMRDLIETLYYAKRGRSPVEEEARIAENFKKKASARTVPAGTSKKDERSFKSLEEVTENVGDLEL